MRADFYSNQINKENIVKYSKIFEIEDDNKVEVSFVYDIKEDEFSITSQIINKENKIIFENKIPFEYFSMNYGYEFIRAFTSYLRNINKDDLIEVPMPDTKFIYKDFYFYNNYQFGYIVGKSGNKNDFISINLMDNELEEFEYETKFDDLYDFLYEVLSSRIKDVKYDEPDFEKIESIYRIDNNQEVLILVNEINNKKSIKYSYSENNIVELGLIESEYAFKNSSEISFENIDNIKYDEDIDGTNRLTIIRKDKSEFIINSDKHDILKNIFDSIKEMI